MALSGRHRGEGLVYCIGLLVLILPCRTSSLAISVPIEVCAIPDSENNTVTLTSSDVDNPANIGKLFVRTDKQTVQMTMQSPECNLNITRLIEVDSIDGVKDKDGLIWYGISFTSYEETLGLWVRVGRNTAHGTTDNSWTWEQLRKCNQNGVNFIFDNDTVVGQKCSRSDNDSTSIPDTTTDWSSNLTFVEGDDDDESGSDDVYNFNYYMGGEVLTVISLGLLISIVLVCLCCFHCQQKKQKSVTLFANEKLLSQTDAFSFTSDKYVYYPGVPLGYEDPKTETSPSSPRALPEPHMDDCQAKEGNISNAPHIDSNTTDSEKYVTSAKNNGSSVFTQVISKPRILQSQFAFKHLKEEK